MSAIVERSADDANAANGCPRCPLLRDALTGWGRLDIAKALAVATRGVIPPPDRYETNDDAGTHAAPVPPTGGRLTATIDFWDDPIDVYSISLAQGEKLFARLSDEPAPVSLTLWQPGTLHVTWPGPVDPAERAAEGAVVGGQERLAFRVPVGGTYYLEVRAGAGLRAVENYELSIALGPSVAGQPGGRTA